MKRRSFLGWAAAAGAASMVPVACASRSAGGSRSVADEPLVLEVAITGGTTKAKNPAAPETVAEQTAEIVRCLDAGAAIVHTHSNQPDPDPAVAAGFYLEAFRPVWDRHPHAILYATANFDPKTYHRERRVWPGGAQCRHHRILAEAGVANMVLLDMGVVPLAMLDEQGVPGPEDAFYWYGFWPDDVRETLSVCRDFGSGASISVFEPGWMKTVVAMARAGTLPRGSKLNIYFAKEEFAAMAPPIPSALELYLDMIKGLDLKWTVGVIGHDVMDTPLARLALERGGSFRVGLEDWPTGPSNVEQLKRAQDLVASVGRPVLTGAEAIEYLDIPFAATRPSAPTGK